MPYTLNRLGEYVAQARTRRALTVASTILTPAHSSAIDERAIARWTTSLEDIHSGLHEMGMRGVALVADYPSVIFAFPASWATRLRVRSPRALKPTEDGLKGSSWETPEFGDGYIEEPPKRGFYAQHTPLHVANSYLEGLKAVQWWQDNFPSDLPENWQMRGTPTDTLRFSPPHRGLSAEHAEYWRHIKMWTHAANKADRGGRPHFAGSELWMPERVFRTLAHDARDFDAHYVLLNINYYGKVVVVDRASQLPLAIVACATRTQNA